MRRTLTPGRSVCLPLLLALAAALGGCNQPSLPCAPAFPLSNGWLGADGDTSFQIATEQSVWLFDDTFVGAASATARSGSAFIHNTIGISTCNTSTGVISMQYFWGDGSSHASPTMFFNSSETASGNAWYWASDAAMVNGAAYLALMKVESTPGVGLGFAVEGITLARISNPTATPGSWSISYSDLTTAPGFYPGAAMLLDSAGQNLLFYTLYDGGNSSLYPKPVILTRIPVADLTSANPAQFIQYYSSSETWVNGLPAQLAEAKQVMPAGQTEFTVRWHSSLGKYVAVMTEPSPYFGNGISTATAPTPEGPWEALSEVYTFPEMTQGSSSYSANTWCYAAKEHPELSTGSSSQATVTYVCNNSSFSTVVSDMAIYVPKTVNITIQ